MRKIVILYYFVFLFSKSWGQSVGIGTATPDAKAALEIKSTDKGVLFPSLTTTQRNLISNPPNGLHIFNTDERCLNYFDTAYRIWNCYCDSCKTVIIDITANTGNVDFYTTYAKYNFSKKYLVRIAAGVTLMGDTALNFSSIPFLASIKIVNYGNVLGSGGDGGRGNVINGTINCATGPCYLAPFFGPNDGKKGGSAIATKTGVTIQVDNYGFVAGGGGGGGGGVGTNNNLGGGGGGGAGSIPGYGGPAGIEYHCVNLTCAVLRAASPGTIGTSTTGGIGGAPSAGSAYGGNGGGLGQPGQNGLGNGVPGTGGTAGKAITGGSGNSINNIGSGQSLGVVD